MQDDRTTETQPRPNLSTENHPDKDVGGTQTQPAPNISTEHQAPGDARNPSDKLDKTQDTPEDDGRRSTLTGSADD